MNAEDRELKARALEAEAVECERKREESFERCDTDGFMSQWALGLGAEKRRMEAMLVRQDGMAEFPALFYLDGRRAPAKMIRTRFGSTWALMDRDGNFTGRFVGTHLKDKTVERHGFRYGHEMARAKVEYVGTDKCNVHPMFVRLDGGCPKEVIEASEERRA